MPTLSKSKLIAFRQCPKRLWLEVYDPKGKGALIDFKTEGFDAAYARTAELVANSRQPVFEAAFRVRHSSPRPQGCR